MGRARRTRARAQIQVPNTRAVLEDDQVERRGFGVGRPADRALQDPRRRAGVSALSEDGVSLRISAAALSTIRSR